MTDAWGIDHTYADALGKHKEAPPASIASLREAIGAPGTGRGPVVVRPGHHPLIEPAELVLEDGSRMEVSQLAPDLPYGYHSLIDDHGERRLIVGPGRCHLPESLRTWGWAVQLYATRSQASWGMGDLADLDTLTEWSSQIGAGMLLVNPLLAVSPTAPRQPSPYYPASRRFLDPIYIRVERVPGAEALGDRLSAATAAGRALNQGSLVDRDEVWRLKSEVLEAIWAATRPSPEFEIWVRSQGGSLETFAAWCVLSEDHGGDWRLWPDAYRDPGGAAVRRLVEERSDRIGWHCWLQWLCRAQLDRAGSRVRLVQDLPIGIDPGGADSWAWQDLLALGVNVGAPPDEFNTKGQDWGLPPFVPQRLRAANYEPFVQTIRAGLTTGGGLRIDHVMGLFRLYWIPPGAGASDGAYVRYPAADLLDIIALESHRAQAVVVGEDLGTVEPGVREEMARRRMLSYRLLWFEEDEPRRWPKLSMASVTTHDLPTVAGLWTGADLDEQKQLDLDPNVESTQRIVSRLAALPCVDEGSAPRDVVVAVHRRLAEAPSLMLCATLEDATGTERRPNIPGTDPQRPNWRLALTQPIESIVDDPVTRQLADLFDLAVTGDRPDPEDGNHDSR